MLHQPPTPFPHSNVPMCKVGIITYRWLNVPQPSLLGLLVQRPHPLCLITHPPLPQC